MKNPSICMFLLLYVSASDVEEVLIDGPVELRSLYGQGDQSLPPLAPYRCKVKIYENTMHRGHFLHSWKKVPSLYDCIGYCSQYTEGPYPCRAVNYFTEIGGCDLLSEASMNPALETVPANMAWINVRHAVIIWCEISGNATEPPSANECGKPYVQPQLQSLHRIRNGDEAVPHSWPWIISVTYFGKHVCGGTLIPIAPGLTETDMVLTAAHCIKHETIGELDLANLAIVVGLHSRADQDGQQVVYADTVHWFDYFMSDSLMNDIALIKTKTPIRFDQNKSPVCLPNQRDPTVINSVCVTTGWGRYKGVDDANLADKLQQLVVPIVESTTCTNESVWGRRVNPITMLCAGDLSGTRNVCKGDSGGALVCLEGDRWVQHGVTSFVYRHDCTAPNKPAVYTRVSMYRFWIDRMIQTWSTVYKNMNAVL